MALSLDTDLRKEKSIKHLAKIQKLKEIAGETSNKVQPPLKYFAPDKTSLIAGSGATHVYVGIMEDGSEVAVKRMLADGCEVSAKNEDKILSLIKTKKSPFIVSYRHFFRDSIFIYLVIDLCEETLKEHVFSQNAEYLQRHGRRMIQEILTGLDFLHKQGVLHRDLKPSNVLVDVDGRMRLADFGISRVLNDDETTVLTDDKGTQGWMAREVIEKKGEGGKVHFKKKSDVQVSGMVAHFILTKGGHPFGDKLVRMANIVGGNPVHLGDLDDPDDHRFVSWLISHNIKDRPYAHEALETLENLHKGNAPGGGRQMLAATEESSFISSKVNPSKDHNNSITINKKPDTLHTSRQIMENCGTDDVTVALETLENLPKENVPRGGGQMLAGTEESSFLSSKMNSSKDHNNWITIGEVINLIKKPVALYTSHIVERWHVTLCKECLSFGLCPNPGRCQTKRKAGDLCPSCNGWYKKLAKSHRNNDERQIKWRENCDTSMWPVDPWEVAKFFMPILGGNKGTTKDAESTDLSSLLNVLTWMKDKAFAPARRVDLYLVNKLRFEVRNPWAQSPNQELPDVDLNNAFDFANKFVSDLDNVFNCKEVKKCTEDIKFVQTYRISNVVEAVLGTNQVKSCLPEKPPTIIGRDPEVKKIISSLVEDGCGIVSIIGGPGFGKSTVAREVSHHLSKKHDVIVIFSFLSNVSTVPEVILRLCRDVGVIPGEDPESSLMFWLKNIERKVVLVMDNIEQLLHSNVRSEFTELVVTLRKNSRRQLQILTTTRNEFLIPGQTVQNVQIGGLDKKSTDLSSTL